MPGWVGCFWWMALEASHWQCCSLVGRPWSQAAPRLPLSAVGWRCTEGSVRGHGGLTNHSGSPPSPHMKLCVPVWPGDSPDGYEAGTGYLT